MKGSELWLLEYMEGASKRFKIPVYQRNYDWRLENCKQLYDDLVKVKRNDRNSHFFGSIVSVLSSNGKYTEYLIIDGQQRLTTVSLLLLAIFNLLKSGVMHSEDKDLADKIYEIYLVDKWDKESKIKLKPIKDDSVAYDRLFGDRSEFKTDSNLTINYDYFYSRIQRGELTVDELYDSISKLEVINIILEHSDEPQLIFESLNSTGVDLTEGDKIRNYILMGLTSKEQSDFYEKYWHRIEKNTEYHVSEFVRDYLSVKRLSTPSMNRIYSAFKDYVQERSLETEALLEDLYSYSKRYSKLLTGNLNDPGICACVQRLNRLETTVTRPFFMEVLRLYEEEDSVLSENDLRSIFYIVEDYLFRRTMCELPTNTLNKTFLTLNKDVLRYDGTPDDYVEKLKYALLNKIERARFPGDKEFIDAFRTRQVYQMNSKNKIYILERLENQGTAEDKDVYRHCDAGDYSIEHIMPQHLTPPWRDSLGDDYQTIHDEWLHRIGNLTLTAYNSKYSNNTFESKKTIDNGFLSSGIRMNQEIAKYEKWGEEELRNRTDKLMQLAIKIWPPIETSYKPAEKEYDSVSLEETAETDVLTGRTIVKYVYQEIEQPVTSWIDMLERVLKTLHEKDKSVLTRLATTKDPSVDLSVWVTDKKEDFDSFLEIDEGVYFARGSSTWNKMSILRRLFPMYGESLDDLTFYLSDKEKPNGEEKYELRKKYWAYALPIIQERHLIRGSFSNVHPTTNNTIAGYFGISGFCVLCTANIDRSQVDFYLGKDNAEENKKAFDLLESHKEEIENRVGASLIWERAESNKASWISYALPEASFMEEANWERMAQFHAEWTDRLCNAMLPYLFVGKEALERELFIAGVFRYWAFYKDGVDLALDKCSRTYTRFVTAQMSKVFPETEEPVSGWKTKNHYFYEILHNGGKSAHIQLTLSSENGTEDFKKVCERVNEIYPTVGDYPKDNWEYRVQYRTQSFDLGDSISKDWLIEKLDEAYEEIKQFESDLITQLESTTD